MINHKLKITLNDEGIYCFECKECGSTFMKVGKHLRTIKEGNANAVHSGSIGGISLDVGIKKQ